jgi:predicted DsbA family dithiol-disulfide isomerase
MSIGFYFDLVCPYSYLLMPEVEAAEDEGLDVTWLPFELRPAPDPLPDPRGVYIRDHWRDHVYGLALAYGAEIHVPRYQPRSTHALAIALYAEDQHAGRAWRAAAHEAFFVEGRDLGAEAVLRDVAQRAGLAPDDAIAGAWDPARLQRLREIRAAAQRLGVHGVPTLVADEAVLFFGAPPPGQIRDRLRALAVA